jgi:hypothetical protein
MTPSHEYLDSMKPKPFNEAKVSISDKWWLTELFHNHDETVRG